MSTSKRRSDPPLLWLFAGLFAYVGLPWFAVPDQFSWTRDLGQIFTQQESATGVLEALRFGRWWLWGPLFGLLIAAAGVLRASGRKPDDELDSLAAGKVLRTCHVRRKHACSRGTCGERASCDPGHGSLQKKIVGRIIGIASACGKRCPGVAQRPRLRSKRS